MATKDVRRQPQRTCIGCRLTSSKRLFVRIVRTPTGEVVVDAASKTAGRGAYLCRQRSCWEAALRQGAVQRALRGPLSAEAQATLRAFAQQVPESDDSASTDGESD